ncbi:hypothetical protein OEZ60_02770 [Defluviimonas sp. WL0024]|uniref:Long-chain fatty acid transport protein n=1 Tax=Albidovulum salinarum TaxID=2984153 RepID=A0ABT2WZ27_9RHOB|nr:hypothetical protein [Defluviimonas sp. WL0024]MCU9846918.1 hypothetical protein [Defluviimonas sp. WL0024]
MGRVIMAAGAFAMGATSAVAGGLERSPQSVAILFEQGNYAEFSIGGINPDVSGTVAGGALSSGDMTTGYGTFSFGYKHALNDKVDLALIIDQPVGVNVSYPISAAPYPFAGSTADVDSLAFTGLIRYKLPQNFSVLGGVRTETVDGVVGIPLFSYTMTADGDRQWGYVLGVAWEKPEIAARVALTYNSAMTHTLSANENFSPVPTEFETEIPQSVNLEFQTGIAKDTLLFGSVRWVEWSVFDITPPAFNSVVGGSIANIDDDTVSYTLGLGRRFNETWSGAVTLGYEPSTGSPTGNLGPTDGYRSIGVAATYTRGNIKVTGGLRYVDIGDATTRGVNGNFTGNEGIGAGLRIGYSF